MTSTLQSAISKQKVLEDWSEHRSFSSFPFNIKQLVALTDLTKETEHAVDYAVSIAQYFKARLTLLYVSAPATVRESYFRVPYTDAERNLLQLEAAIRLKQVPSSACLRSGRYAEETFKVAEERSADLLVISENNLTWFSYFITEDDNGKFIFDAPCPVAVVSDCACRVAKQVNDFSLGHTRMQLRELVAGAADRPRRLSCPSSSRQDWVLSR